VDERRTAWSAAADVVDTTPDPMAGIHVRGTVACMTTEPGTGEPDCGTDTGWAVDKVGGAAPASEKISTEDMAVADGSTP